VRTAWTACAAQHPARVEPGANRYRRAPLGSLPFILVSPLLAALPLLARCCGLPAPPRPGGDVPYLAAAATYCSDRDASACIRRDHALIHPALTPDPPTLVLVSLSDSAMVAKAGEPKTLLLDKIEAAVRALAEPAGSTRVAILKFLKSQNGLAS